MDMMGIGTSPSEEGRFILLLGPIQGDLNLNHLVGPEVPVRELKKGGEVFLEIGPLEDEVQAMILSEGLKSSFPFPLEILTR